MYNSIYHIIVLFIKNVLNTVSDLGTRSLDDLTSDLLALSMSFSTEMTELALAYANTRIRKDKAFRKEEGLTLHKRDCRRSYLTELGEIHYVRDYYVDKETGKYRHLLDEMIGVDRRDRVGKNVSARMVQEATGHSYAEASRIVTNGTVSRQTVRNKILKLGALEYHPENEKPRVVSELHIYADEDHDHLQKPGKKKGKQLQINPLVVVTEGTQSVGSNRNETINAVRFVDSQFDVRRLNDSVEGYLYETYDMEKVDKIYLHADGGQWIRGLLAENDRKIEVLDGFHLEKYLRRLSAKFPNANTRYRLMCAITNDDRQKAEEIFRSLRDKAQDKASKKVLDSVSSYILNHWEAAVRRKTEDIPGSCTEAQVSHVLSARFSSTPLGWSKEGLGKLSSQRVYVLNGGTIKGSDFRKTEADERPYAEYIEKIMSEKLDWSIIEGSIQNIFDTASGTYQLIRNLGRIRDCTLS